MITNLQQREVFHLAILRQLAVRLRPNSYALKGGVNLRFFFNSVRYSEDMDLDVQGIETFKLKEIVMDILTSKILQMNLRPFGIEQIVPPDISSAKQTDTTQRFKVHLITASKEDLFTKIEFSKRKMDSPIKIEAINSAMLQMYKLPPLIVPHYPAEVAIRQKIRALADRSETQGRDIFDIYLLLPYFDEAKLRSISKPSLEKAYHRTFEIDLERFRSSVLNYLSEDDMKMYDRKEVWEEIQTKVGEAIEHSTIDL